MKRLLVLFAIALFAAHSLAWSASNGKEKASLKSGEKAAAAETAQPKEAGRVTKLTGSAEIFRAENTFPAALGFVVREGDRVEVAAKSSVEITLFNTPGKPVEGEANPTVLTLSENAKLTIKVRRLEPSGDVTTQLELSQGKLDSNVKDGRQAGWKARREKMRARSRGRSYRVTKSNYQVKTPTAIAGVRGTQFIVAVTPSKTFVYVKSGRVWVKELVRGEIRTVGRRRLLEIGMNGFGAMFKADSSVEDSMASPSYAPDFNPTRYSSKTAAREPGATGEPQVGEETVNSDVEKDMEDARAPQTSGDSPDPAADLGPGPSTAPGGSGGGGGGGTGPEPLPDPPPPPPAPSGG